MDASGFGLSEMVYDMIQNHADIDTRSEFYKHIVLSGGSSMYPGLPSRMERDIKNLYLKNVLQGDMTRMNRLKLRIEAPPRRKHMVYLGASVLGELMRNRKEEFWITKKAYEEQGVEQLIEKVATLKT